MNAGFSISLGEIPEPCSVFKYQEESLLHVHVELVLSPLSRTRIPRPEHINDIEIYPDTCDSFLQGPSFFEAAIRVKGRRHPYVGTDMTMNSAGCNPWKFIRLLIGSHNFF